MYLTRAWIAAAALAMGMTALAAEGPSDQLAFMKEPEWLGQQYVGAREWVELDTLVEKLAASKERAEDGRFHLYLMTQAISHRFLNVPGETHKSEFAEYRQQVPNSAFLPILEAMEMHASAWLARGQGLSSTVTPEGWQMFKERNEAAWELILAAKKTSDRLPTWYEQAISIGMDADVRNDELTAIFNEGIKRFPGYHSIYFVYARQFAPRWGGDYDSADAFINAQVAAKTNPDGEVLYARLYWLIDQYAADPDFFENASVSWPRMRAGFEQLMKQFPNGKRNQASFVAFACRASDAATYFKWRQSVHGGFFSQVASDGISLEVCDARFTRKT